MKSLAIIFISLFCGYFGNSQILPKVTLNDNSELKLSKLTVNAEISGNYASVVYDMTFYNGLDRVLEGELAFPLAQGQSVTNLAMDLNGKLREAVIVEKELGRVAYENTIKQRIDPALLEQTKGNNYKVRVYPIPAKGFKRIVITYEETLALSDGNYHFLLPFGFKDRLDEFQLNITNSSLNTIPVIIGEFKNLLKFEREKGNLVVKLSLKNQSVNNSLRLSIPVENSERIISQDNYFYFTKAFDSKSRIKEKPKSILLLWDASYSMQYKDLEKELHLLDSYFKYLGSVSIDVKIFSNTLIDSEFYKVVNGNWDTLKEKLKNVVYDGGTSFQGLKLTNTDEVIIVSDGMHNLGALEPTNNLRLYAINSVQSANHKYLASLANGFGGDYLNLNKTVISQALDQLKSAPFQFLGISENNRVYETYPKKNTIVNGGFALAGKQFNADELELQFGYNGKVSERVKINFENALPSKVAKRLWAKQKLSDLLNDKEKNKSKIIEHCKANRLISAYTSMIVLDKIEDYVRYKIEPPQELQNQYKQLLSRSKQDEINRNKLIAERIDELKDDYLALRKWHNKNFKLKKKKRIRNRDASKNNSTTTNTAVNSTASTTIQNTSAINRNHIDESKPIVRGTVTTTMDGLPLPGVSVIVKGTSRGAQTDFDGKFIINAEPNETLVLSYVGTQTSEIIVESQNNIKVALKEDVDALDEVVVTAYGGMVTKAKSVASSVSSVQYESVTNTLQSLQGQASGINISSFSGQPSTDKNDVIIRGQSSLSSSTNPLYVIDGVPVSKSEFKTLNSDEIYNISILKDANAVVIYGNRGANGVIIVKTKKGHASDSEDIKALEQKIEQETGLKAWNKEDSYLELFQAQTDSHSAYKLYLELRQTYRNTPSFFLDVAEYFESQNEMKYALRIISNLIEIDIDNHELIRALGYKLDQYELHELAIYVYKEVLELRPEEPQSYRDLALAYQANGNNIKAFELFQKIVEGQLLEKDQDENYYGIEHIAYTELCQLMNSKIGRALPAYKEDYKLIDADIRVVIDWNHNNTDLDLHITNPAGEKIYYSNPKSKYGGRLSEDMTEGYGPESFMIKKAQKGNYNIEVKYYSDEVQKIIGPPSLKVTLIKNYGRKNEEREIKVFRLTEDEGKLKVGSLNF